MKESKYVPLILKELDKGAASIGTLKKKCGQGNKITNIRKALHQLLKNNVIEVNGYDDKCKIFNYDCIMFKKVNPNYKNPIYIKGLLDNPLENDNYMKIREIFKKKFEEINQIYYEEIEELKKITGQMPLKQAIELGYFKTSDTFRLRERGPSEELTIPFSNVLAHDPDASIWYFKKEFDSKLGLIFGLQEKKYPYFGDSVRVEYKGHKQGELSFTYSYECFLDHLPIPNYCEESLFKHLVIRPLSASGEEKERLLWEISTDLADEFLINFVDYLRIIDILTEDDFQRITKHLKI